MRCICRDCCHVLGQEIVCRALQLLDRVTPEDSEVCVYFSIMCVLCVNTVGRDDKVVRKGKLSNIFSKVTTIKIM